MDFASRSPQWPNGARCAVSISFDCAGESLIHSVYPGEYENHLSTQAYTRYEEIAIPRIRQAFQNLNIKQTFFVPAWCLERYPQVFTDLLEAGHELALKGYMHESPTALTVEEERFWLQTSYVLMESFTGTKPLGYRAPFGHVSRRTAELLAEQGVLYDSSMHNDNDPYIMATSQGDVIEIPTDWTMLDDWSQYGQLTTMGVDHSPRPVSTAAEVWFAEFEEAYRSGGIFVATFHPMLSGRPSRLRGLMRFIERIQERADVWFAPISEIACHVRDSTQRDGSPIPRVDWPLSPPVPSIDFTADPHPGYARYKAARAGNDWDR